MRIRRMPPTMIVYPKVMSILAVENEEYVLQRINRLIAR